MDSDETVVADRRAGAPRWSPSQRRKTERKKREVPRYNVILWDSDDHSYEYVERMLRELFGHTPEAMPQDGRDGRHARQSHRAHDDQGARRAEARPDSSPTAKTTSCKNCKGSMHATIESAE